MATTVAWHVSDRWMVDNQEGDERYFDNDDRGAAIQCAIDLKKMKDSPKCVLVYNKNGKGIALNIPVKKDD